METPRLIKLGYDDTRRGLQRSDDALHSCIDLSLPPPLPACYIITHTELFAFRSEWVG